MSSTPIPPPGGGQDKASIVLQVSVDTTTGALQVANFAEVLKHLGVAAEGAGDAAGGAGMAAQKGAQGWLDLAAQTYAAGKAMQVYGDIAKAAIIETTMIAARTEVMNTTLAVTARNMNYTTAAAEAQVDAVRKLNITHQDSINLTTQFMRAQLDLTKTTQLARAAQDLAAISGENSSTVASHLTEAIQAQSVMMLRQYGIVTRSEAIFDQYASKLNRSAASLTDIERRQAFLNRILLEAAKMQGAYTASMEDAGKKMGSLTRVFQDAREHIGERFLPIMGRVVDAFMAFGEWLGKTPGWLIDLAGVLTMTVTSLAATATAVYGVTRALQALQAAAAGAAGAEGLGMIVSFVKAHPYVLAVAAALAAIASTWMLISSRQEASLKNTVNALRQEQGRVEQVKNLEKSYAELEETENRLTSIREGRADFNERELRTFSGLSVEENRRYQLSRLQEEVDARRKMLAQDAKAISSDIVEITKDQGTGQVKNVVNMERARAEGEKAARAAALELDNLKKIQETRQQERDAALEQLQRAQEVAKIAEGLIGTSEQSVDAAMRYKDQIAGARQEVEKKRKELELVTSELRAAQKEASGLQLVAQDFSTISAGLQQGIGFWQQLYQAQKLGVQASKDDLKILQDSLESAGAKMRDVGTSAQAAIERMKTAGTPVSPELEKAAETIKARTEELAKASEAAVKKNAGNFAAQALAVAGYIGELGKYQGELKELGVEVGNMLSNQQAALGVRTATINNMRGLEQEATQRRIAMMRLEQSVLGSMVSNYGTRAKQVELELRMEEQMFVQRARQLSLGQQYISMQRAAAERVRDLRLEAIQREKNNEMAQQELATVQETNALRGFTEAGMIEIAEKRQALYRRYMEERFAGEKELAEMIRLMEVQLEAQRDSIRREGLQRRIQQETLMLRNLAAPAQIATQRGLASDEEIRGVEQMYRLLDEKEMERWKTSGEYLEVFNRDRDEAEKALNAKRAAMEASTNETIRQLWMQTYDMRDMRERTMQQYRVSAEIAAGRLSQGRGDTLLRELDTRQQIARVARQMPEYAAELAKLQEEILDGLKREEQIRSIQSRASLANQLREASQNVNIVEFFPEQGMMEKSLELMKQAREQAVLMAQESSAALQRAIDSGDVDAAANAWRRYAEALQLVKTTSEGLTTSAQTLQTVFMGLASGAIASFEAMARGQSALQALRQAMSDVIREEVMRRVKPKIAMEAAEAASAAARLDFGKMGRHLLAMSKWIAVGAIAGVAASGAAGNMTGGPGSTWGPQEQGREPVQTRASIEDNIIRLEQAIYRNGRLILQQGDRYSNLSKTFIEQVEKGTLAAPVANMVATTISDKLNAASQQQSQGSQETQVLLRQIHQQLVIANEEQPQPIIVNNEVSIEGSDVTNLLEGSYVRSSQKFVRDNAASLGRAIDENAARRDLGRVLTDGGL